MDSRGKLYLALLLIFILFALVIAVYTGIKNYLVNKRADRKKIVFKKKDGKLKGYWKTKQGEYYDKDLKSED